MKISLCLHRDVILGFNPFPGAPVQAARAERITFFAAVKVLYALVNTKA